MITNKELTEVSLSPTKKDYYQIWGELLDLASKISTRWSPDSTNESDPGIVLLKALTAIADKLNYNIDKNTLEAFMPSATQQESMRKLTEMMGYTMKYYRAATGEVSIAYKENGEKELGKDITKIYFPRFVNLKNEEEDINYVTLEDFSITESEPARSIKVIEGEVVECETDNDNIISLTHLDDNHRYLLPETNVAENGIFICNIVESNGTSRESDEWKQVNNLNTQLLGAQVFKFGFDSNENLPYVQFPEDISQLIKDGLRIRYIRTNGLTGNISRNILCKLEKPALWETAEDGDPVRDLTADDFSVINNEAIKNGANPETLTEAYNNFKKTIGTFDTLVTCRDYMNKIYQLTVSNTNITPLVSNIIVSDIRDDINRATTLCSFNDYGICYSDVSLKNNNGDNLINHFDLMLYPFKTIYGLNNESEYKNSFKINNENLNKIKYDLKNNKTISHNFITPNSDEIACIKNYLRLKSKITTIKKVTLDEELEILSNIYTAIYKNFNCRMIDFGEEIPYDIIYSTIKNADARIKDISLDEPVLFTKIMAYDGTEYEIVTSDEGTPHELSDWMLKYNKLVLRNVLAGKIAAFQYNTDFDTSYKESTYADYAKVYPDTDAKITKLVSKFDLKNTTEMELNGYKLQENEVVQFRAPNLKTTVTYPAYVNYYLHLNTENRRSTNAIPAVFKPVNELLLETKSTTPTKNTYWEYFVNDFEVDGNAHKVNLTKATTITGTNAAENFDTIKTSFGCLFVNEVFNALTSESQYDTQTIYYLKDALNIYTIAEGITSENFDENKDHLYTKASTEYYIINNFIGTEINYYYFDINTEITPTVNNYAALANYIGEILADAYHTESVSNKLFTIKRTDITLMPGYLVDTNYNKYDETSTLPSGITSTTRIFIAENLGKDSSGFDITKDSEYELGPGEYLLINYTHSENDESGNEKKSVINMAYTEGKIIKPNFGIIDSSIYHNTHSYSKRNNGDLDFTKYNITNPDGMFTLDTSEQIEIRDIVKIELDEADTLIYWNRNDEDENAASHEFTFNENYGDGTNNAYTLKDGEYLYYTNSRKINIAYYGAGSIIVRSTPTLRLFKSKLNGNVTADDILTNGFDIIPWVVIVLSKDKKITVVENQYITLTEGDIFYEATAKTTQGTGSSNKQDLDNEWRPVSAARYKFAEDNLDSNLPIISITNLYWSARTRLDFNMGPETAQALHEKDSIVLYSGDTELKTLKPNDQEDFNPINLYSNYKCQIANHEVTIKDISDFKTKVARLDLPELNPDSAESTGHVLNLDNYINGSTRYTKFSFSEISDDLDDHPAFRLNIAIPNAEEFGLIMFYYNDENYVEDHLTAAGNPRRNIHQPAHLIVTGEGGAEISRFNMEDEPKSIYYLKPGIQVLKLTPAVSKLEVYADTQQVAGIIFSKLSIVQGINKKLRYQYDSTVPSNNGLETLLSDIRNTGIADNFYYNIPVEAEHAIELNSAISEDNLLNPTAWYDPNNANNKFVVSEIAVEDLATGITLTKASRI